MLRERPASPSTATGAVAGTAAPRSSVAISFGSPAQESGVTRLDLNEILIRHPQAAFLMRIAGDSMREAGICDGDLALIDRALDAAHGQVVIAIVNDEFICRRLHRKAGALRLEAPGHPADDWVPAEGEELQIWGVVTHVVRPVGSAAAE